MATQKIEPKQLDFSDLPNGDVTNTAGVLGTLKHNRAAVAAPTGSDDSAAGYAIGSTWVFGSTIYEATSVGVGTATWRQIYPALLSAATGILSVGQGGTNADLSATGGSGFVLKQSSAGAAIIVAALVAADIPELAISKITGLQGALDAKASATHQHLGAGVNSVGLGSAAVASGTSSAAVGDGAKVTSGSGVALGHIATCSLNATAAIGYNAQAAAIGAMALGGGSLGSGVNANAIGRFALASGGASIALGYSANASADYSIATGCNAIASGHSSIALGAFSDAFGPDSIALGRSVSAAAGEFVVSPFVTKFCLAATPTVPATAGAIGRVGQTAWDAGYFYLCVALNTWKRTALVTW